MREKEKMTMFNRKAYIHTRRFMSSNKNGDNEIQAKKQQPQKKKKPFFFVSSPWGRFRF